MEETERGAPAEPLTAEPPADAMSAAEVVARPAGGPPPLAIFLGITVLALASFGASALVLGGAGRVPSGEPEPTATATVTAAPARTAGAAAPAATAAVRRVRVVSVAGRSRPIASGAQHEVTFTWTLDGAREGDLAVIQLSAGSRSLGQQRGTLDPSVFSFSTGALTLTKTLDCSTAGWSAEILTIRGQPLEGDSEATVPGVRC